MLPTPAQRSAALSSIGSGLTNEASSLLVSAFLSQLDASEGSRAQYNKTARRFLAWITDTGRNLEAMSRADIIAYRDSLAASLSPYTVNSYLTVVKMFYQWAEANKLYPNIAAGVKVPRRQSRFQRDYLTVNQARELLCNMAAEATLRDYAIVSLMLRTGLRTVEIIRANKEDLQKKGGVNVLLVQGKGHTSKDDFVILSDKCAAALEAYMQTRPEATPGEPLFISDSRRNTGERLTTRTVRSIARKYLDAIGLNDRQHTAHSLRHTCACLMLENGSSAQDVQRTLRHSNPATTQIYTYHVEEHLRLQRAAELSLDSLI